jgi:hypothetical protein
LSPLPTADSRETGSSRLPAKTKTVTNIFLDYLVDDSKIVVTLAMQALSDLAIKNAAVSTRVLSAIEKLTRTGSAAIQARGKKLLPKLKDLSLF